MDPSWAMEVRNSPKKVPKGVGSLLTLRLRNRPFDLSINEKCGALHPMDIKKNGRIISVCQQKYLKEWEILATYSEIFQKVWQFMFKHGTQQKNITRHSPGISGIFEQ